MILSACGSDEKEVEGEVVGLVTQGQEQSRLSRERSTLLGSLPQGTLPRHAAAASLLVVTVFSCHCLV